MRARNLAMFVAAVVAAGPVSSVCHAQAFGDQLPVGWSGWKPYDSTSAQPGTGVAIDTADALRAAQRPARFLSADRLWENYRAWTPYQYGMNNPLTLTDPSGDSVIFQGGPEGELERHFNTAVNYLAANGVDVSRIRRLQNDPDKHVTLQWSDELNGNEYRPFYGGGTAFWNPFAAAEFVDENTPAMPGDVSGKLSPALILFHELGGHGYDWKYDDDGNDADRNSMKRDPVFGTVNERNVIQGLEQPAAQILGQGVRNCHCGEGYRVDSPTTTVRSR